MGLFKPAWQGDYTEKALQAVEKVSNKAELEEIARNALAWTVRKVAILKLVDAKTETYYSHLDSEGYPMSTKGPSLCAPEGYPMSTKGPSLCALSLCALFVLSKQWDRAIVMVIDPMCRGC